MRYFLIVGLFILSGYVSAQNSKLVLNLEQAVKIALENNHDLKQAELEKQKAIEKVRQTFGESVLPNVEGSANYSRALKRPAFFLETPFFSGSFPAGTNNNLVAGVQVDQPLATASMFLATKIAETYSEIADVTKLLSEAELIIKVKESYYAYLLAKEYLKVADLQLKRTEENLKNTKEMFSVGRVSEYDLIRANVQFQNSKPLVIEAKNNIELAANNFKILLGLELKTVIEIVGELTFNHYGSKYGEGNINKLLDSNLLIKQFYKNTVLQELSSSFQFSQHYPELRAFSNWQLQSQENDDRSFTNWRFINSISIGINLRIPIFKGFAIDSKYQQARIDQEKSIEALSKTKKEIERDYLNTLASIQKTEIQIESYKSAVDETEKGFHIAQKRYSSGLSTQIEITDALVSVSQAKYNYINTVFVYNILLAKLDFLLGKSKEELHY